MAESILTRDVRAIRRVAPPDAPCAATLAMIAETALLLVDSSDAAVLDSVRFVGAEHVWAPTDVWRRADGHDVSMPRLVDPLEMFLERRRGGTMRAGEVVTLACSLLRGMRELRADEKSGEFAGRWWVTDAGRPVFAIVPGDTLAAATARAFDLLAEHADDRDLVRVLAEAATCCGATDIELLRGLEAELVGVAEPGPVELSALTSSDDATPWGALDAMAPKRRAGFERLPQPAQAGRARLLPTAVLDVAERMSKRVRAWRSSRDVSASKPLSLRSGRGGLRSESARPPRESREQSDPRERAPRSRKRVWSVAIALGAAVVVIGAMWPEGREPAPAPSTVAHAGGEKPTDAASAPTVTATPSGVDGSAQVPPTLAPALVQAKEGQPELTSVAAALVGAAAGCDATTTCAETFVDPSLASLVPRSGVVELLDDYGGIAVFLLTGNDQAETTIVIEKRGDTWKIREVYEGATS